VIARVLDRQSRLMRQRQGSAANPLSGSSLLDCSAERTAPCGREVWRQSPGRRRRGWTGAPPTRHERAEGRSARARVQGGIAQCGARGSRVSGRLLSPLAGARASDTRPAICMLAHCSIRASRKLLVWRIALAVRPMHRCPCTMLPRHLSGCTLPRRALHCPQMRALQAEVSAGVPVL